MGNREIAGSAGGGSSSRPVVVECMQCGAPVAVKRLGPVPRYCSARCGRRFRAAASSERRSSNPAVQVDLSGRRRPAALPAPSDTSPAPPALAAPARPVRTALPATAPVLQLPAGKAEPVTRPQTPPDRPTSVERFELAPHLPVEQRTRSRRRVEPITRLREQQNMAIALDFILFAIGALTFLGGALWLMGPAGFLVWLFAGVPGLWFAVMGRHVQGRFR